MADISPIIYARFWSKVSVPPSNLECWEWKGATNANGYGNFKMPSQAGSYTVGAHRAAYMLFHGDYPQDGLVIRHTCDNPRCVNPHHMLTGTVGDNVRDSFERGRRGPPTIRKVGSENPMAKLTENDVVEIRRMIADGHTNTAIAKIYNVTHSNISDIRRGKTWRSA